MKLLVWLNNTYFISFTDLAFDPNALYPGTSPYPGYPWNPGFPWNHEYLWNPRYVSVPNYFLSLMMAVFQFFLSLDKIDLAEIRRNRIQNCLVAYEPLLTDSCLLEWKLGDDSNLRVIIAFVCWIFVIFLSISSCYFFYMSMSFVYFAL